MISDEHDTDNIEQETLNENVAENPPEIANHAEQDELIEYLLAVSGINTSLVDASTTPDLMVDAINDDCEGNLEDSDFDFQDWAENH